MASSVATGFVKRSATLARTPALMARRQATLQQKSVATTSEPLLSTILEIRAPQLTYSIVCDQLMLNYDHAFE